MPELSLRRFLSLHSAKEIRNTKMALLYYIKGPNNQMIPAYENMDLVLDYVDSCYKAYYGSYTNFEVGQVCFGFVKMPEKDQWLLVSVGRITKVPKVGEEELYCQREYLPEYQDLLGEVVISYHLGWTHHRSIFYISNFIDKAKVIKAPSLLCGKKEAEPLIKFIDYQHVNLTHEQVDDILGGLGDGNYYYKLATFRGVYLLTDINNNKQFVGSITGDKGIEGDWKNGLDTHSKGNHHLQSLYKKYGYGYFNNFSFAVLEAFNSSASEDAILERENYWKNMLGTILRGYNIEGPKKSPNLDEVLNRLNNKIS